MITKIKTKFKGKAITGNIEVMFRLSIVSNNNLITLVMG